MSDLPKISQAELDRLANDTSVALGLGDMSAGRQQIFLDPQIPIGCYDLAPNAQLEKKALEPGAIFPADLVEAIIYKANNCGVSPMTLLRQWIPLALIKGKALQRNPETDMDEMLDLDLEFKEVLADQKVATELKRKPADDGKEPSPVDALIKMFLKDQSTCYQLWSRARAIGVSNRAYLVLLVDALVGGNATKELIRDSKEAMAEYNKLRKKKHLLTDALGMLGAN